MGVSTKDLFGKVAINEGLYKLSDSDLERLHKIQLEILDDLVQLCEKEDLTVLLQAGTLIGAVLYKGFIPWDDDIDLFMPRKDYDHLIKIFNQFLGHKYVLQSPETEPNGSFGFIKIRKKNTVFNEVETAGFPIHKGIFIDISPLENAPDNNFERIFHGLGCILLRQITVACGLFKYPSKPMKVLRKQSFKLNILMKMKEFIGFVFSFQSIGKWNLLANSFCGKYKNKNSDFFVSPYSPGLGYFKETYKKDVFLPLIKMDFEGRKLNVPGKYDEVLRKKYGSVSKDYPEEKRIQHWVTNLDFGDNI